MYQTTFMVACKKFFKMLPGQTLKSFKEELDKLTKEDRLDFIEMFRTVDIEIVQNSN